MKRILLPLLILAFLLINVLPTEAATKKTSSSSILASGKYIKNKNVVNISVRNLKGVKKVSYILMYQGNGIGQGVEGSFSPGKKTSWSKNVYLGTCSGKVCVSHKNIKNIQLEVTTKYTNGKSSTKMYKVK